MNTKDIITYIEESIKNNRPVGAICYTYLDGHQSECIGFMPCSLKQAQKQIEYLKGNNK